MNLDELRKPFPADRISWRLGATNGDKTKGMALAYIDARDVMERLDEVCGLDWQCSYVPMPNGTCCCSIGVRVGNEWIWRSNGAMNLADSDKADAKEMAEKGSYSDAFKRAAVLFGIGRYLYDLDSPWVEIEPAGRSYKIKACEYARLRKLLEGGKPSVPPTPPPADSTPQARAAAWVEKASYELLTFKTDKDLSAWLQKNNGAIERLRDVDASLYNTINAKIANRSDELRKIAA
jgi:hypothetical protein